MGEGLARRARNRWNGAMPQKMALRAYIDKLRTEGYTVRDDHGDDPILISPDGSAVETWREEYPYPELMSRNSYEVEKYLLQIELLKFQYWTMDSGAKHVIVFEGRDAAGKGGTIKRFTEHLNPRAARVDRVMGFCTDEEHATFISQAPNFERMLVESGTTVTKLWFSVTQDEQRTRFAIRQIDPVRRWKLSPMDLESLDRWEAYTAAKEEMLKYTDKGYAPWITVKSNDKKRARVNALRAFLHQFDYEGKDHDVVFAPDPKVVRRAKYTVGD